MSCVPTRCIATEGCIVLPVDFPGLIRLNLDAARRARLPRHQMWDAAVHSDRARGCGAAERLEPSNRHVRTAVRVPAP